MERGVRCQICKEPMYYSGDPKHEEEFTIVVEKYHKPVDGFNVHERCWKQMGMGMKTLKDSLPYDAQTGERQLKNLYDVRVIKQHTMTNDYEPYIRWPGIHKNVMTWWELENGYAVGWNENPAIGWSFPVVKLKI